MEPFDWQSLPDKIIIGVDEVGRGCLAGPVYAAAACLDPTKDFSSFTDSKALSGRRRESLAEQIKRDHQVAVAFATVEEITRINILQASLLAMKRAIQMLGYGQGHVLVDGKQKIPELKDYKQTPLIKGDLRAAPIAAASIVAKVTRDQLLVELEEDFPNYGFAKHKGYSTQAHKAAIEKFGPCVHHRPSFAGVKEHLRN